MVDPVDDAVREAYRRLTGNELSDLPDEQQEMFRFLPPDAEWHDITFVLDRPSASQARRLAARQARKRQP
jgi:hypothetical protein